MVLTWVAPAWVTPSAQQIDDLHWIAYRVAIETGCERSAGAAAAIAWIRGERLGPVTERDEQPVTQKIAQCEMWAAIAMQRVGAPPPLEYIAEKLKVRHWDPQPVQTAWASGAALALMWIVGESDRCPMTLPVRHPDGRICTADELFEARVAVEPYSYQLPERRIELHSRCVEVARRSRQLAELIEDTRRRLAA